MTTKTYTHEEVMTCEISLAFRAAHGRSGFAKAGRVVSGLLKAAANKGEITRHSSIARVSDTVWYEISEQKLANIRAEAMARAAA